MENTFYFAHIANNDLVLNRIRSILNGGFVYQEAYKIFTRLVHEAVRSDVLKNYIKVERGSELWPYLKLHSDNLEMIKLLGYNIEELTLLDDYDYPELIGYKISW